MRLKNIKISNYRCFKETSIDFDNRVTLIVGKNGASVYQALQEKGYNPINQIVGYILSEDPTYITNHNNARALIRRVDRDELLQTLVKYYLTH